MNTWLKSLLTGLVIAALVFFIYQNFDPQNGKPFFTVHYIMEATPEKESAGQRNEDIKEALNKIPGIIKRRCEAAGYSAIVRILSNNTKLDVTIQHVHDTSYAAYIITRNNKLEFREIYTLYEIPSLLTIGKEATKEHLPPAEKKSHDSAGSLKISEIIPAGGKEPSGLDTLITFSNTYSMTGSDGSSTAEIGSINEKDTALLNKILQSPESLQQLPPDTKFYYGPAADLSKRKGAKIFHLYAIRTGGNEIAVLQNRDIESAKQDYDLSGRPEINFRFSPTGARKWAQMTRANIGRYIAILLDHSVITAPRVNQAIEGGISSISGAFTVEEARMLAAQLNSGAIPANLHIIKQDVIAESTGNKGKLLLIVLATFVVASGFAWFVFNTLKNR